MHKPIPLSVLIDTIQHGVLTKESRGKTYSADVEVTNVLVQDKTMRVEENGNYVFVSGALMFWDVVNSSAATFHIGDKITYIDKGTGAEVSRYVKDILKAQTTDNLHHIELTLI